MNPEFQCSIFMFLFLSDESSFLGVDDVIYALLP